MDFTCIIIDDEPHAIAELTDLVALVPRLSLLATFRDVSQAVRYLQEVGPVGIIFSDIDMPNVSGIDSAPLFHKYAAHLVYVTAHRKYALDAFDADASAYLIKPVEKSIFLEKMDRLTGLQSTPRSQAGDGDQLFIKGSSKNSFLRINYNDIVYIEAMLNYVIVHTVDNRHITYIGLSEIAERLKHKNLFFRINKSIIISANFITRVEGNAVYLSNQMNFTVGATYKNAFHEYIAKRTLNR